MADTVHMLSLIAVTAVAGLAHALALRYGADSRKLDGRPNW
jgi:hypothetical protein